MRQLTEAEKRDNAELARLSKKIAHRDSIRMAVALKHGAKAGGRKLVKAIRNAHRGFKNWQGSMRQEDKLYFEQKQRGKQYHE